MANSLTAIARLKARKALEEARANPAVTALDFTRGGLLGATTDTLGYIPDAVADFMRPMGYSVPPEKVIGGSQWLANKVSAPTGSTAESAGRMLGGMVAPGADDLMRMAGLLPKKVPIQEMTVYHGSPHDFDKFDLSKIGTGEGVQMYGHGLYVAEKPGVAKSYRTAGMPDLEQNIALKYFGAGRLSDDQWAYAKPSIQKRIQQDPELQELLKADPSIADDILEAARGDGGADGATTSAALAAMNRLKNKLPKQKGHFYEVDLPDSHIANMLDWDAPLSQQPESVRKALNFEVVKDPEFAQGLSDSPWVLNLNGQTINGYKTRKEALAAIQDSTGAQLYSTLAGGQGQPWASKKLAEFGIPGIKYLDGGSRAAGEGSRNYVVFDDKILKILKKE